MEKESKIKQVLEFFGGCIVFAVVIYFAFFAGWQSTPSCSTEYIEGRMDLKVVRNECPSMTQRFLVDSINEYFTNNKADLPQDRKQTLLTEVQNNYE